MRTILISDKAWQALKDAQLLMQAQKNKKYNYSQTILELWGSY